MVFHKLFQVNNVSKPNILVVEDDPDIQQLVTYNLIKAGTGFFGRYQNRTCNRVATI